MQDVSSSSVKKTVVLHPMMDKYVRKTWAILIENDYDATYSMALNFMILVAIQEGIKDGSLSEETRDVVWEFDWVDIPEPIQQFITARAASITSQRIIGDGDQYEMLQQQEAFARATALEYETQQGQFTIFGHPNEQTNYYPAYQPFHALRR